MNHFSYQKGFLHIEDVSCIDLAKKYPTPCYVYSLNYIKKQYQRYQKSLPKIKIYYAVKSNSNLSILKLLHDIGAGFDAVSLGELKKIKIVANTLTNTVFAGVAKTADEITFALENHIGCLHVESESELELIGKIALKMGKQAPISIRINPNIDAKTHPKITTGLEENKFGIGIDDAIMLYQKIKAQKHYKIIGIDCHIGSQITDLSAFEKAFLSLKDTYFKLKELGIEINTINLGGGLGIDYINLEDAPIEQYAQLIKKFFNFPCQLAIEPGRSLIAHSGILLTKIIRKKTNQNTNFTIVDASMSEMIRPALYGAAHSIAMVNKSLPAKKLTHLVGGVCESSDTFAKKYSTKR